MTTLYVVATPIGNLKDTSERIRETLANVSLVLAEDTRRTKILLSYLGLSPRLVSYHHHTTAKRLQEILDLINNQSVALVSDAGTPGISDPGGVLIARAWERYGDNFRAIPIPGPCALVAAVSVCGFPADEFIFFGFPPHKKGRETFFDNLAETVKTVVFYESPHRLVKTLHSLVRRQPERMLVVAREMTKKFETIYRGTTLSVAEKLSSALPPGEYTLVLAPRDYRGPAK